jgi:hypothetical protein
MLEVYLLEQRTGLGVFVQAEKYISWVSFVHTFFVEAEAVHAKGHSTSGSQQPC